MRSPNTLMSSQKRKSSDSQSSPSNRMIYREFGSNDNSSAVERPSIEQPPAQQNPRVQASRKGRKGKTVTVITNLQLKEENLEALLKQLKSQCGAGGTIKDNEIEIQGDHTQKIAQFLISLGYKAKISGG